MSDLNKVFLNGNITNDLNEKSFVFIGNGTAKLSVSIAVNKSIKRGDSWENKPSFFEVVCWGKLAERIKGYAKKGQRISVSGELSQESWESNGQKHSKVVVIADNVELATVCKGENTNGSGYTPSGNTGFTPVNNDGFPEDTPF